MGEENLKDYLVDKFKEVVMIVGNLWGGKVGEENVKDYVVDKFKEVVRGKVGEVNVKDYVVDKFKEVVRRKEGEENVKDYVVDKFKEVVMIVGNLWGGKVGEENVKDYVVDKLHRWFQVGAPFLIAGLVLVLFCRCCGGRGGGRSGKTMKAPGRDHRMPRKEFVDNPRAYFRDLRSKNSN